MHVLAVGAGAPCSPTPFEILPVAESGEAVARLRCLAGASGIFLELREGETLRLRVEVPALPGDELAVSFRRSGQGHLVAESPGRRVLHLATDVPYEPPKVLPPPAAGAPLDLALLVDGTMRAGGTNGGWLLGDPGAWADEVATLVAFAEALAGDAAPFRAAVFAFADEPLPNAKAPDLLPAYKLHPGPEARQLEALDPARLTRRLLALPPSPGGDFVDALARAIADCHSLAWRDEARKVVLVLGDSPGFSLLYPAPPGSDGRSRACDVDEEALRLHDSGVELITLYHSPSEDELAAALAIERSLLDFAAAQYCRIASRPELAFGTADFEPITAAEVLRTREGRLGRGATWGEWVT